MFESAELGHAIDAERYNQELPRLRRELLEAQLELVEARRFAVIIIIAGMDGAGKGDTVNVLNEWMDPRHIQTHAPGEPTETDLARPPMWRYWRALPPKGKIGIFFDAIYSEAIRDRVYDRIGNSELDQALERGNRFEKMLVDEGALVLKFWLHLSEKRQKKRFDKLEKDPATSWRVNKDDWRNHKHYGKFRQVAERALRQTSSAEAPWTIIEGYDARYRELTLGEALLQALRQRLAVETVPPQPAVTVPPLVPRIDELNVLRALDLSLDLDKKDYEEQLAQWQGKLNKLSRKKGFGELSVVAVFEGNDAAGKGGSIRRVTGALDARRYQVVQVAAPTDEEDDHPYLWRFWRHLPERGKLVIFDRSWYGRVLVERVEGFCAETDWMRAYGEINDFEEQLIRNRTLVVKFWLAIDQDEQLRRFKAREEIPFKNFKITEDDWRNREKWPLYEEAVCDMVERTSTEIAPWTLVEANSKRYARVKVLKTLVERIEQALEKD
ncbi:polyphosphate:AMP phosphotransferase [Trichloromonas acetexigens]|jgi:polyphosphate:AMP phosphotransferase|uniref:Polyphosphate:AMP phosphotransferase n=1 Tax=Trichloromonas acetexigens TaxID=38815 RepID=A0A550JH20_9BACT|nr:polyphosphate:AMP phosphotransferase [Desulfuromonas acetexigens]TRO82514.1 polyphosphate:AMP phosphotransferase [Desulfuromonas acetexigens]